MMINQTSRLLSKSSLQYKFNGSICLSLYRLISNENYLKIKSFDNKYATLIIDGKEIKYDWIFLRDSCQCHACVDASTTQKKHNLADIPLNIVPKYDGIKILNGNTLEIFWNQSLLNENGKINHRSLFSDQWLRLYSSLKNISNARFNDVKKIYWNRNDIEKINLNVDCNDYLHSDKGLYKVLRFLHDYGIVFIDNVVGEYAVEELTQRIGDIRHTFYGKSWDVKSVEKAINVAYTSQALELHMDLLYFEAPPGLQFLHSLSNNVKGGESYFVDSFQIAETLRKNDPEAFRILCSYPVTFHYRNANRHYHITRSTIILNQFTPDRSIDHINYAPPFQAPFECDTSKPEFRQFVGAFKKFRDMINDPNNQIELFLKKNQCVIFNNRRVLHARRQFDALTGERWFKGCYTDLDNFKDRFRILHEKFQTNDNMKS